MVGGPWADFPSLPTAAEGDNINEVAPRPFLVRLPTSLLTADLAIILRRAAT